MAEMVLTDIDKVYENGFHAVKDLSLTVADGEFLVLVGPSGCGKTTALRMIAGLEDITDGTLAIGGKVVNDLPSRDRNIAMVFQSYALYPHMTVGENIGFGLAIRKEPKAVIAEKVAKAAELLDLTSMLDRKPAQLSGGQRQRVAMGRAIVRDAELFLMDEPLSNLDAKLRVQMRAEIASLQEKLGTTTVYVTHDQVEAMTMGHRVAVMRLGELQQIAPPQELYDAPDNVFVAGFIGTPPMTLFHADLVIEGDAARLHVGDQELALPMGVIDARPSLRALSGREVIVGMRAEDIYPTEAEGRQALNVVVTMTEALGSSVHLGFSFAGSPVDEARLGSGLKNDDEHGLSALAAEGGVQGVAAFPPRIQTRIGERLTMWVDMGRLHFFDVESGRALR
ncbi:MAG: sn-glycerol-3-phosphate ABC transporter ATP-binding protein UgpC [Candidatus Nanopelagicales bacterium]|nr:sn-glycerol-3-phosphate ABC transporter ATP-binding protein UgpC [Candidatus Nanopelagicales bacterium]